MASRSAFGGSGSGSGQSSASGKVVGTAPGLISAFHIVTSGCSGLDGAVWRGTLQTAGARVRRHPQLPQLSLPVRCLVSDATAGRRARPCRRLPTGGRHRLSGGGGIRIQTRGGKSISGRAVRTLGCSRPSTERLPTTLENGCLDSIP